MVRVKKRISIVLVDDDPPTHEGIVGLIRAQRGFQVQALPADLEALALIVPATRPDLVLLNLSGKGKDRLTIAGALHRAAPALPVIIMGVSPNRANVEGLVRAGVAGFIMANAHSTRT
jgi:DNA-binding NarL/FixJ family response regulator